jgi:hypothetical protein
MVPRTGSYAHDVAIWDSSIVQGPISVAPRQTLIVTIHTLLRHRCVRQVMSASRVCRAWRCTALELLLGDTASSKPLRPMMGKPRVAPTTSGFTTMVCASPPPADTASSKPLRPMMGKPRVAPTTSTNPLVAKDAQPRSHALTPPF